MQEIDCVEAKKEESPFRSFNHSIKHESISKLVSYVHPKSTEQVRLVIRGV